VAGWPDPISPSGSDSFGAGSGPERTRVPPEACFHGGAFFDAIGVEFEDLSRRARVINADVLDAWFPPAPSVIAALSEHLPWLLRTSPPTSCEGLTATIARVRNLPGGCLLPGAGSSDLIFRALRSWLSPASRVLLLDPTYGEYAHFCEQSIGCRVVDRFVLHREDRYRLDLEALETALEKGYDLLILVNPNNPTGRHIPRAQLEPLLRRLPPETRCWVDEAYLEYVGAEQTLEPLATELPNVVVCKSLSKVYALSGARAAYLVGPEPLVHDLRRHTPPWAVGLLAQVAAVAALQAPEYYADRYRETHTLREALAAGLRAHCPGLDVLSGATNSVLCHLPTDGPDAAAVVAHCRNQDLFLRDVRGMGPSVGSRVFRIAVKDAATQERILEILSGIGKEVLIGK